MHWLWGVHAYRLLSTVSRRRPRLTIYHLLANLNWRDNAWRVGTIRLQNTHSGILLTSESVGIKCLSQPKKLYENSKVLTRLRDVVRTNDQQPPRAADCRDQN